MAEIVILVNDQLDGCTYRLAPESKRFLDDQPPHKKPVSSLYVSFDHQAESQWTEGDLWRHVAEMLTGRSIDEVKALGKIKFVDPRSKSVVFEAVPENV